MSERMGIGPTVSPATKQHLQQQASQPFREPVEETTMVEEGEPETLKAYYEQKRKMRERQNKGATMEIGPDGLLVPREKKKGPLRLAKPSSEPIKVDWSGY